jgi:[NiFe] hydrogenase diaphorase moiety large subunit
MSEDMAAVKKVCADCGNDKGRLMDILIAVQELHGCVSDDSIETIAAAVSAPRVVVESAVSFYAFLSKTPKGKVVVRVCNDIVDRMNGADVVAKAFCDELGIEVGETTPDGKISLEYTPCIGMSDQPPSALVNDQVLTYLSSDSAREIVRTLREDGDPRQLVHRVGDGNNADPIVHSGVHNNIRKKGDVIFAFGDFQTDNGLEKALAMSPVEVLNEMKVARLRGRGGAGFPTGMKWEFTRSAEGDEKYVICNADEGEPGTFKDRVLLTELSDRIFEGMTIAGYAIGATRGILYLRGEYAYLQKLLMRTLDERRKRGVLGDDIMGKGVSFDIRIQMGAGAYICGEETSLISSCEGERGDPKNRPPFPANKGYHGRPTTVNNVETFCAAVRVMEKGAGWFAEIGSKQSTGTKVLSVSGDCQAPGVYEVPFGISVQELLELVEAEKPKAVQIGGPSGQMIGVDDFDRTICYDDLATGGSVMVFGEQRDILEIAHYFMEFFVEESCGYCTPCRVGNVLLKSYLEKVMAGKADESDLEIMKEVGETTKLASRCGLGQTSANPVLTTLEKFRSEYESKLRSSADGLQPSFDLTAAISQASEIAERGSVHASE